MKSKGTVYLVGAGPGDAGLLTMRGAELLARADVVVYDALINQDLLRLAPKGVEIIYAGKRSKDHAIPQDELNDLLVAKAREGKTVIRLKGGDPYIFGRGGEEASKLAAAKIVLRSRLSPVFPPLWPGRITPAFRSRIATIAPVSPSSPAMKTRKKAGRPAWIGRRLPKSPAPRSSSWASSASASFPAIS